MGEVHLAESNYLACLLCILVEERVMGKLFLGSLVSLKPAGSVQLSIVDIVTHGKIQRLLDK